MKVTALEEYGFRCILQLAARDIDEEAMTISQIAKTERISIPYVAKLMNLLKNAGFVLSVRGPKGGYRLSRDAGEITLAQVLLALDDTLFHSDFCQRYSGECKECVHYRGSCGLRAVWSVLAEQIQGVLSQTTLAELVGKTEPILANILRRRFGEQQVTLRGTTSTLRG